MRLVPESNFGKIQFYSTRLGRWTDHALEIGTSAEEVAALEAETAEARAALLAQRMAQDAARSATIRLNAAIEKMTRRGAGIVQQIRAKAATSPAGDNVYSLAWIRQPAKGSPIAPPGKATRFEVELTAIGSLVLRWKCKNPRGAIGTMYHVRRQVIGSNEGFQYLGCVGEREFTDETVPAGASAIVYQVQAMRSTATGPVATFNVNFGVRRAVKLAKATATPPSIAA